MVSPVEEVSEELGLVDTAAAIAAADIGLEKLNTALVDEVPKVSTVDVELLRNMRIKADLHFSALNQNIMGSLIGAVLRM